MSRVLLILFMDFPIIERPKKYSEFEYHAKLFFALKELGYDVRGEVSSRFRGRKSVFDLVIFNHSGAAIIILFFNEKKTPSFR